MYILNTPLTQAVASCKNRDPTIDLNSDLWKEKQSIYDGSPLINSSRIYILPIEEYEGKVMGNIEAQNMIKLYFPRDHSNYNYSLFPTNDKVIALVYDLLHIPFSNSFYFKTLITKTIIPIRVYCVCRDVRGFEGKFVCEMKKAINTNRHIDIHRKQRTQLLQTIVSIILPSTYIIPNRYNPLILIGRVTIKIANATKAFNTMGSVFKIAITLFLLLPVALTIFMVQKVTHKHFPFPFHRKSH